MSRIHKYKGGARVDRQLTRHGKRLVLKALKDIAKNGPETNTVGTCGNVINALRLAAGTDEAILTAYVEHFLSDLWRDWPEHSGDPSWPVDNPYVFGVGSYGMWDGERGARRMSLVAFAIEQLRTQV